MKCTTCGFKVEERPQDGKCPQCGKMLISAGKATEPVGQEPQNPIKQIYRENAERPTEDPFLFSLGFTSLIGGMIIALGLFINLFDDNPVKGILIGAWIFFIHFIIYQNARQSDRFFIERPQRSNWISMLVISLGVSFIFQMKFGQDALIPRTFSTFALPAWIFMVHLLLYFIRINLIENEIGGKYLSSWGYLMFVWFVTALFGIRVLISFVGLVYDSPVPGFIALGMTLWWVFLHTVLFYQVRWLHLTFPVSDSEIKEIIPPKQFIGYFGAIFLIIGVYVPLGYVQLDILSANRCMFGLSEAYSVILLLMGIGSIWMTAMKKFRWMWLTGLFSLAIVIGIAFFTSRHAMFPELNLEDLTRQLSDPKSTTIVSYTWSDLISIEWGGRITLLGGCLMLLISAWLDTRQTIIAFLKDHFAGNKTVSVEN